MILKTVLKSLEGEFVLNIDGSELYCESGTAAVGVLDPSAVYAIRKIRAKDGKVCVEVSDQTDAIAKWNKDWMEAEQEKNGVAPSFF